MTSSAGSRAPGPLRVTPLSRLSQKSWYGSADSKYDVVVPRIGSRNLDPWVELGMNQVCLELITTAGLQNVTDNGSSRN